MVRIGDDLEIDDDELSFVASRSAGPGGQNVNKVNTRMTLRFDVGASSALDDEAKARIRERLASRITKGGVVQVSSQRHRSQAQNRAAAIERFAELIAWALEEETERRPTKVPRRVHRKRVADKRHRSRVKELRRDPSGGDG